MERHEKRPVSVAQERLYDIQADGTEILFLRHFVHIADGTSGKLVYHYDTDLNGQPYELSGIRIGAGSYNVYAGVMCMQDPEFPNEVTRVRMFFSNGGQVVYTTMQGMPIMEWPTGVSFVECEE